ncbi:MAG: hypothetical protein ABEJ07_04390 [Candidatus Nanohaloarchaea archaeon]
MFAAMSYNLEKTEDLKNDSIDQHPALEVALNNLDEDVAEDIEKEIEENRSEGRIDEEELDKIIEKYDLDKEQKKKVKEKIVKYSSVLIFLYFDYQF